MITQSGHGTSRARKASVALELLDNPDKRRALGTIDSSAMRNILAVAQAASSLDEIELVIQYQQARMKRWDPKVGKLLIDIARAAADGIDGDAEEAHRRRALAAAEQLGLVARAHKVISERDREDRKKNENKGAKR